MTDPLHVLASVSACVALAGLGQAAAGWAALSRHMRQAEPVLDAYPPVTVLKPLHGAEPLLEEALASLCTQDYPAFQIVFAAQDPHDPALVVVQRLRARFPDMDIAVTVDSTLHGANRKIGNLLNAWPQAKHGIVVIADSDIHAGPGYLRSLVGALMQPGTGLATTLYTGLPANAALAALLGAAQINHSFLPGALMARGLGRQDCLGATMALRRETLEALGGLRALADHLADDAVLGRLVRAQGLRVALARTVPATTVPEDRLPDLFHHELRWARTIRRLEPVDFVLAGLQYPLFWAALAWALAPGVGPGLFLLAWLARAVLAFGVERRLGVATGAPIWCLPLRDAMSVAVMLASYRTSKVAWRGQTLRATPAPRLSALPQGPLP